MQPTSASPRAVVSVEGLRVVFNPSAPQPTVAVDGLGYTLHAGKTLAVVGESGSGKTVSTLALMGLLPTANCSVSGSIRFAPDTGEGIQVLGLPEHELNRLRGRKMGMIFQEPMTSLNPVLRCGPQVAEVLQKHEGLSGGAAREKVVALFEEVRLPRPQNIYTSYPHQISGGQKQRVMIAMAIACNPALLIADEPTTALDVSVQASILHLLKEIQEKYGTSIIFISHDLSVVADIANDVLVMRNGQMVEYGPVQQIFGSPQHDYTRGLLTCRPPLEKRIHRLPTLADIMENRPRPVIEDPPADMQQGLLLAVEVENATKEFVLERSLLGTPRKTLKAVDEVSLRLPEGQTLGIVGESGSGKSTLGRCIAGLLNHDKGTIRIKGVEQNPSNRKKLHKTIQFVFQDPYASLNPRMAVGSAVMEPLLVHRLVPNKAQTRQQAEQLLAQVGLNGDFLQRYPHELSGGQRQRICIARALAMRPKVMVFDESVAALDTSVQAQVLNLLKDLKDEYGMSYIFISHDMAVIRFMADQIMVMHNGRAVEMAGADALLDNPQTDYTRMLLEAVPRPPVLFR